MTTSPRRKPRHLASSPFKPEPEAVVEIYDIDDLVSHDAFGMGRVTEVEEAAVTVDFRTKTVRLLSPYPRMSKL